MNNDMVLSFCRLVASSGVYPSLIANKFQHLLVVNNSKLSQHTTLMPSPRGKIEARTKVLYLRLVTHRSPSLSTNIKKEHQNGKLEDSLMGLKKEQRAFAPTSYVVHPLAPLCYAMPHLQSISQPFCTFPSSVFPLSHLRVVFCPAARWCIPST